jgi:hypothetical protein
MTKVNIAAAIAAAAALVFAAGCRRSSVAAPPPQPQPPPQPSQLPEDPVEGAKATAQWRAHLAEEERERKLRYDRDRMKDHRAVLRFMESTRARYDRAANAAAVAAIRARLPPAIEAVRGRITRIDKWGVNSGLLQDYDAMLKALADTYPAGKEDFDAREQRIKDWLAEAAEAEDE